MKKNKQIILKRLAVTIGIVVFYQILSLIMIPGVNNSALAKVSQNSGLTMLGMFSAGGFSQYSLMSLGISSYITAQIVIQLLQSEVVPKFTQWSKEGKTGREKLDKVTKVLALILSITESISITLGLNSMSDNEFVLDNNPFTYIVIGILLTAGSFIGVWLSDQITSKGLGSGVSVLIAGGIIAKFPNMIGILGGILRVNGQVNWAGIIEVIFMIIVAVFVIFWFSTSELRVPVQYAQRESITGKQSYLPLKILIPGVMPIIFASQIFSIPQIILGFFKLSERSTWHRLITDIFNLQTGSGVILYGLLILFFTYLYSFVQMDPGKLAESFQRLNAYIPGVYPGNPTSNYIVRILKKLAFPGGIFLVVISCLPLIIANNLTSTLQLGLSGSSILIITGAIVEVSRQIKGLTMKQEYGSLLNDEFSLE